MSIQERRLRSTSWRPPLRYSAWSMSCLMRKTPRPCVAKMFSETVGSGSPEGSNPSPSSVITRTSVRPFSQPPQIVIFFPGSLRLP